MKGCIRPEARFRFHAAYRPLSGILSRYVLRMLPSIVVYNYLYKIKTSYVTF